MQRIPTLAAFFVLLTALGAATVTLHAGTQTFTLQGSNATVHINVTVNVSHVSVHPELVELGAANLSVRNTTSNRTTLNLYAWDPDASDGNVAVNFSANTTDGHNVTFAVGGLTASTDYFLDRDGSRIATLTTDGSGNLSFFNSAWTRRSFVLTPNTTAESDDGGDGDGDGGGGGGGDGDGDDGDGGTSLTIARTVTVEHSDDRFQATVENAAANTTVTIRLFRNMTDDPGFGVDEVDIGVRKDGDYTVNVSNTATPPAETEAFNGSQAERTVGYLDIAHTFTDDATNNGTIRFRVAPEAIETRPENVDLRRYDDGWEALPTTHTGSDDDYHTYTAETTGFSTFVIAERRPRLSLAGTWLASANVTAGDPATITTAVENTGSATGNMTVTVDVANTTRTRTVSVSPQTAKNVTFTATTGAAGAHPVTVNGEPLAVLTVSAAPEEGGVFSIIIPLLLVFLTALILVSAATIGYRYRDTIRSRLQGRGAERSTQSLEYRLNEVQEHVATLQRRDAIPQPGRVVEELERAENAIDRGDEEAARDALNAIENILSGGPGQGPRF